ncbi:hypothetical protein BCR35DRAFT_300285 [Leucosporidium creatinivorum]|uniref:Transmembrane protein 135 N-terminal domain-containing protein n=1 Tax=Leucosporidium creatinivorum TaxID=106004 RepID=A0A1Y2G043_9BASI|nr:hypothetical protein BCR35DRAFT_300285 [Leucosporidium creatinivorum]
MASAPGSSQACSTLSSAQLRALAFVATREEYGKLARVVDTLIGRTGRSLKLPRAPMIFGENQSNEEGGHAATVSRSSTRLFALIYSLAALYEFLLSLIRRKKFSTVLRSLSSLSALRLASAVSLYSTLYRLLLPSLSSFLPTLSPPASPSSSFPLSLTSLKRRTLNSNAVPPFLAGVAASPALLLEGRGQRRVTIALYAFTRAVHGLVGVAGTKGWISKAMREGRWWWGGHLIFAASNAILLHSFVYTPTTFPPTYSSFILRFSSAYLPSPSSSSSSRTTWPTPRALVDGIATSSRLHYPAFISPLLHPSSKKGFVVDVEGAGARALDAIRPVLDDRAHPGHSRLTCAFLHPEEVGCWEVFARFVKGEFKGASKFFGALAVLGTLTRWKKFLREPEEGIYRALLSTITSSAFLSLSLGTAWSTICFFQHYLPGHFIPTKRFYLQGFLAGLWVRLVGAQRSTDLGLYSARLAIQCAWDVLVQKGRVQNIRNGEVLYFGLSMGVLLALHEANPEALQSKLVRSALRRVGGPSLAEVAAEKEKEERKK